MTNFPEKQNGDYEPSSSSNDPPKSTATSTSKCFTFASTSSLNWNKPSTSTAPKYFSGYTISAANTSSTHADGEKSSTSRFTDNHTDSLYYKGKPVIRFPEFVKTCCSENRELGNLIFKKVSNDVYRTTFHKLHHYKKDKERCTEVRKIDFKLNTKLNTGVKQDWEIRRDTKSTNVWHVGKSYSPTKLIENLKSKNSTEDGFEILYTGTGDRILDTIFTAEKADDGIVLRVDKLKRTEYDAYQAKVAEFENGTDESRAGKTGGASGQTGKGYRIGKPDRTAVKKGSSYIDDAITGKGNRSKNNSETTDKVGRIISAGTANQESVAKSTAAADKLEAFDPCEIAHGSVGPGKDKDQNIETNSTISNPQAGEPTLQNLKDEDHVTDKSTNKPLKPASGAVEIEPGREKSMVLEKSCSSTDLPDRIEKISSTNFKEKAEKISTSTDLPKTGFVGMDHEKQEKLLSRLSKYISAFNDSWQKLCDEIPAGKENEFLSASCELIFDFSFKIFTKVFRVENSSSTSNFILDHTLAKQFQFSWKLIIIGAGANKRILKDDSLRGKNGDDVFSFLKCMHDKIEYAETKVNILKTSIVKNTREQEIPLPLKMAEFIEDKILKLFNKIVSVEKERILSGKLLDACLKITENPPSERKEWKKVIKSMLDVCRVKENDKEGVNDKENGQTSPLIESVLYSCE